MIDKPIIIDGVDISGCEYYNKDDKTCREVNGNYDTDICDFDKCENSNCCYKQLKRKKQECEELKEKYKWYDHYKEQALYNKNLCNEKSKQLDQLKQTLNGIKEIAEENIRIADLEGLNGVYRRGLAKQILQKISECEVKR